MATKLTEIWPWCFCDFSPPLPSLSLLLQPHWPLRHSFNLTYTFPPQSLCTSHSRLDLPSSRSPCDSPPAFFVQMIPCLFKTPLPCHSLSPSMAFFFSFQIYHPLKHSMFHLFIQCVICPYILHQNRSSMRAGYFFKTLSFMGFV